MATLDEIVENSLYTEVKKLRDGISLVMDPKTDKIYLRKVLDVFSVPVFEYLNSHTDVHIPRIKAFWEEGDKLVVIEEYIQGTTLEELLEKGQDYKGDKFEFGEIKRILIELCDGLIFLHGANPPIIHRDVKASNVIISEDGRVKLIDYDAAKQFAKGKKKDTVLIGTQGIAAPEQYGFAQSDERTDIFALGKLMERMLSGIEHSEAGQAEKIVEKATKLQPELRYKSIQEMKTAIERLKSPMDKSSPVDKRLMAAAAVIAFLLLITGVMMLMFNLGKKAGGKSAKNSPETAVATLSDADKNGGVAGVASAGDTSAESEKIENGDKVVDVELKVKHIDGATGEVPDSDEYDVLVVDIDTQSVGNYIGFSKKYSEGVLEQSKDDFIPILTNKIIDDGWVYANEPFACICNKNDPSYDISEKYSFTFAGDKLDGHPSEYAVLGLTVDYMFEDGFNSDGVTTFEVDEYGGMRGIAAGMNTIFTEFLEAKGHLVFISDRLKDHTEGGREHFFGYVITDNVVKNEY